MIERLAVAMVLVSACSERPVPRGGGAPEDPFVGTECGLSSDSFGLRLARQLDILFVVDNSETMGTEQDRLQGQFDALIQALADVPGGFPDSHIGVISTDLGTGTFETEWCETIGGDAGRLQSEPRGACQGPTDAYIQVAVSGERLTANVPNVQGYPHIDLADVQEAFRCIASLGTGGCRFEQPLEAARIALACDAVSCPNPGFLRPESLLVVVFLGDEDDCSAANPAIFDPSQNSAAAPLGYFSSYRCFEFGTVCDQPIGRTGGQGLTGCAPDEDSPYLRPVASYQDFFTALRSPGRLLLAAITGPFQPGDALHTTQTGGGPVVDPTCTAGSDFAMPAIRIHDLIRRFGSDGIVLADHDNVGICGDDFAPALQRVGEAIRARVSPGCLSQSLVRAAADGEPQLVDSPEQASCVVTETTAELSTERERCVFEGPAPFACSAPDVSPGTLSPASEPSCWYVCDAGAAQTGGCAYRWEVRFCRDAACSPEPPDDLADTVVTAECLSCDLPSLCGDGKCQDQLGEREICPIDCSSNFDDGAAKP